MHNPAVVVVLALVFVDEVLTVSGNGASSWRRETELVGGDPFVRDSPLLAAVTSC